MRWFLVGRTFEPISFATCEEAWDMFFNLPQEMVEYDGEVAVIPEDQFMRR